MPALVRRHDPAVVTAAAVAFTVAAGTIAVAAAAALAATAAAAGRNASAVAVGSAVALGAIVAAIVAVIVVVIVAVIVAVVVAVVASAGLTVFVFLRLTRAATAGCAGGPTALIEKIVDRGSGWRRSTLRSPPFDRAALCA